MRAFLAFLPVLLVAFEARATTTLVGLPNPPTVRLEGAFSSRCRTWATQYEQHELERTKDLQLSAGEAEAWAKARAAKAARLCERVSLPASSAWPSGRAVSDADLGLPAGYLAATGLTEADLQTWRKAVGARATDVWVRTRDNEALVNDAFRSHCSRKPGGIGSERDWIWCRVAGWELEIDPMAQLEKTVIRIAAVGASALALFGLALLLFLGRRAARKAPPRT